MFVTKISIRAESVVESPFRLIAKWLPPVIDEVDPMEGDQVALDTPGASSNTSAAALYVFVMSGLTVKVVPEIAVIV